MKTMRIAELREHLVKSYDDVEFVRKKRNGVYEIVKNPYNTIYELVKSIENFRDDVQFCDMYMEIYELYTYGGVAIDLTQEINGEVE